MAGYKPYPIYQTTTSPWQARIPSHWSLVRLKDLVSYNDDSLDEHTDPNYEIEYVDIGSLSHLGGVSSSETLSFDKAPSRARRIVKHGDILISTVRTYLKAIAAISNPPANMIASTGFAVLRPKANINAQFVGYLLQTDGFVGEVVARSVGVSYPAINASDLVRIAVAEPPLEEQQSIASFLVHKTAQIDVLIAKKQALLAKLAEKRTALIRQVVTKGLDPLAPTRESGVEWIGSIPAHWDCGNLRRFAQMKTGHTPSRSEAEYWLDCCIPWFSLADVWQLRDGKRKYLGNTKELISSLGLRNSAAELLPAGTVVFSRTASVGFSGIMPVPMATTQDFWNWICGKKLMPDYLLLVFRSMRQEIGRITSGSTHKTVYQGDAASLRVCVPPLSEQAKIVEFVESQTATIDGLSEKVVAAIDRLQEYRSSLITHAVTGQIDVRQMPIPEALHHA